MAVWKCALCSHIYDEAKESTPWMDLPDDWVCPVCGNTVENAVPDTCPICNVPGSKFFEIS